MRIALAFFLFCIAGPWSFAQGDATAPRRPAPSLTQPKGATNPVDARGFIHR